MATLSPPPQHPTLTTAKLLIHSSPPSQTPFPKLSSFPSLTHPGTSRFSRCAKPNSSSSEEARKIVDEAFFFGDGDYDLADEDDSDDDGGQDEEETEESSVELLMRFVQSMFKKISKRAKKASRSVLPPAISTQLVSFAVDGLMLLASLSIVKALLEVFCTLGGTVFVSILLLRVIWATVSYFQTNGNNFSQGGSSYGPAQPIS